MKLIKKFKTGITFLLLGSVMLISLATVVKANTEYTWVTYAYYGDEEDVSDFERKETTSKIRLVLNRSTATLDFQAVGAYEESPGDNYYDCSNGRYVRAYASSDVRAFNITNMVNEWGYPYAGVLASAVYDGYALADGYFYADY